MRKVLRALRFFGACLGVVLVCAVAAVLQAQIRSYPSGGMTELISNGITITSTLPILAPDGSTSQAGLGFASVPTAGIYLAGTDTVLNAGDGAGRVQIFRSSGAATWYIDSSTGSHPLRPSANDIRDIGQTTRGVRELFLIRGIQGQDAKALTESSATTVFDCALAAGIHTGGRINYCVYAADATDQQQRCAQIHIAAANKSGTTTCGITTVTGNTTVNQTTDANAAAITAGTLTYTVTCTDTTDSFALQFNAVSSLTQTTLQSEVRWDWLIPVACTPS